MMNKFLSTLTWLIVLGDVNSELLNHAYQKPAKSTTDRGVLKVADGCKAEMKGALPCCFSTPSMLNPWVLVDLLVPVEISLVKIYGNLCSERVSTLNCEESNPLWLLLTNESIKSTDHLNESLFTKHRLYPYNGLFHIPQDPPVTARRVVVQKFETTVMTVCEIEVYGECADMLRPCLRSDCRTDVSNRCVHTCSMGFYGPGCSEKCGKCKNIFCDSLDGRCTGSCLSGFKGPYCNEECSDGKWGKNCLLTCGQCQIACSNVGLCKGGRCLPGWQGTRCLQKCHEYTYGAECSNTCGHCFDKMTCDYVTGRCINGCAHGWIGETCSKPCLDGWFGRNCENRCGRCMVNPCNKQTGACNLSGCLPGWTGSRCDKLCANYSYGENCSEECGFCSNTQPCSPTTGFCPMGCDPAFEDQFCKTATVNETGSKALVYLFIIVAAAVFVALVLASLYKRGGGNRTSTS